MVEPPDLPSADEGTGTNASGWRDDAPTSRLMLAPQQPAEQGTPPTEPTCGTVLRARFVLKDVIGYGGTSLIYRASDLHRALPQEMAASAVAIKMLRAEQRDDPLALTLLQREFQQMQCLSHPGIARVFDLDCDGDVWFMSMELVVGRTIKAWMQSYDSHEDAQSIIVRCGEALEHAHSLGIVHGDLKPTNVMITNDGAVRLIDFGSAPSPGTVVAAGSRPILGITPLYASPQILAGQAAEPRDDVYSLACLAYYMLSSGQHPFGGHPALEDGRAKTAPDHVRTIPAELFAVIARGLSAERNRRQKSVGDFVRELTEAERLRAEAASARTQTGDTVLVASHAPPRRSRPAWLAPPLVRFAALGAAAIGLVAMVWPGSEQPTTLPPPLRPVAAAVPILAIAKTGPAAGAAAPSFTPVKRIVARTAPSSVSFEAPTIRASAMQSLVAIPVRRLTNSGSAAFVWRVEGGSAQAGVDYQGTEPQVVRFHDGQSVRTLFVPLVRHSGTSTQREPRTFAVALERVAGGPALGDISRVTVAIDSLPPPVSRRPATYQASRSVAPKLPDCRQRAPLRLACLFSWRPRFGGASTVSD
jgi:serine/threonine protein kinase